MRIPMKFEVIPEKDEYGNIKFRGVGSVGSQIFFTNALYTTKDAAELVIKQIVTLEQEKAERNGLGE